MCPNKQFLSIYFDGEFPAVWKKQMDQHLEGCPQCRELLGLYKKTSELLNDVEVSDADAAMKAAKARVWEKINSDKRRHSLRQTPRLLTRLTRSLPAAAAGAFAAASLIFVMLFITQFKIDKSELPELSSVEEISEGIVASSNYELDVPEITPALNMNEVLRYLENDDTSNIVIIKLPERKKFMRYGEPAFINAADYSRRSAN
ncbi:MAG: zf-HC2 domain-containing protein [Spirochaetaceae bacterium]|jgi:hypothetical protein|nr:zf-HC2 domain-containing protein [Spirochaetaceae bacterium]